MPTCSITWDLVERAIMLLPLAMHSLAHKIASPSHRTWRPATDIWLEFICSKISLSSFDIIPSVTHLVCPTTRLCRQHGRSNNHWASKGAHRGQCSGENRGQSSSVPSDSGRPSLSGVLHVSPQARALTDVPHTRHSGRMKLIPSAGCHENTGEAEKGCAAK